MLTCHRSTNLYAHITRDTLTGSILFNICTQYHVSECTKGRQLQTLLFDKVLWPHVWKRCLQTDGEYEYITVKIAQPHNHQLTMLTYRWMILYLHNLELFYHIQTQTACHPKASNKLSQCNYSTLTLFRPCCVRAEHSRYLRECTLLASFWPCSRLIG